MFRFQWSREVRNYFEDNKGLVDKLELAFAEFRNSGVMLPEHGLIDMIAPLQYTWGIHEHIVLFRQSKEGVEWKLQVEVIKPVRSIYDEILL